MTTSIDSLMPLATDDDLFEVCFGGGTAHRAVGFGAGPNVDVGVLSCEHVQGARKLLAVCRCVGRDAEKEQRWGHCVTSRRRH